MSSSPRKKQKIELTIAPEDEDTPRPILALFASSNPPAAGTPFSLYTNTKDEERSLIAAETAEMEYESRNLVNPGTEGTGLSAQYMIGVHDPRTNTLTLHSAPVHSISSSVKSLKGLPGVQSSTQFAVQRAALGTTFGTRKAIRAINAQERNKLDQDSFGTNHSSNSLQSILQNSIASSSALLPTKIDIDKVANQSRPIPLYNLLATTPGDVYDFDSIVSEVELGTFDVERLVGVKTLKERLTFLPFKRSDFVQTKLRRLVPNRLDDDVPVPILARKDKEKLKLVVHLATLFAFRDYAGRTGVRGVDRAELVKRLGTELNPASNLVIDCLLERYTELQKSGGEEKRIMSSTMEIKLLSYMVVLMLKLDKWSTDVGTVAHDLGMGSKKVGEIFRSLGCSLTPPSNEERAALVASGKAESLAAAKSMSKATLKVPLTFPVERRGPKKR